MKKSIGMKNKLEDLKNQVQKFLDESKVTEAKDKMEEVKNLKAAIEIQEQLEKEEEDSLALANTLANVENKYNSEENGIPKNKVKENASFIRAALKKVTGGNLTEAENALLLPSTTAVNGENGEGYILPQDIRTQITKKMREYKSIRDYIGYMPTGALSGSFPVENFESVAGLVDFTDGTDGEEGKDIKFTNVKYSLKEKAAFVKLSNTLLSLTDNALISYVIEIFAKKAVVTENSMGFTTLKSNKTAKTLADWKALKTSLNKDLDPAVLFGSTIVTNQDGFELLDSALDTIGRPILQPNPANPTQKIFAGYNVIVFSNSMLASTAATTMTKAKAPFYYGNLKEAIKIVDLNGNVAFATSKEAGFMSNTTVARLIEFIDVVQVDKSDKCYCYAEMEFGEKATV